jgi:hypothetical protein
MARDIKQKLCRYLTADILSVRANVQEIWRSFSIRNLRQNVGEG